MGLFYKHLSRFLQVGGVGFIIDASLLWVLVYPLEMPPVMSRAISFVVTIGFTFVLNARYTFDVTLRDSSKSRYGMIQVMGAVINFVSYSGLVLIGPLAGMPLLALVAGSALSSVHNFFMMRRFVFAGITDKYPS